MRRLYTLYQQSLTAIGALLSFAFLLSCADEHMIDVDTEGDTGGTPGWIWTPRIEIQKGNNQATLHLINPLPGATSMVPGPDDPDYYKIWVSTTGLENFKYHGQVDVSTTSLQFDQLENGKPYYFFVTSHKENFPYGHSDTVMTIPSEPSSSQPLFNINLSVKRVSASVDLTYFTYVHNDVLYVRPALGNSTLVASDAYSASWSPIANQFVYVTRVQEDIYSFPYEMKLFESETKQTSTLFQSDYHNYSFQRPVFTPDGHRLTFLSSEGNSERHHYDFWILDPASQSRIKISNFEAVSFLPNGTYDWSSSAEDIYLTGRYDGEYDRDIYKYNLSTKVITPVILSSWDNSSPSVSPDNHKIAFISKRTGQDELWIYDLVTSEYSQITGSHYQFDSRYANPEWLSNEQMLITLSEGEISFPVVINVN